MRKKNQQIHLKFNHFSFRKNLKNSLFSQRTFIRVHRRQSNLTCRILLPINFIDFKVALEQLTMWTNWSVGMMYVTNSLNLIVPILSACHVTINSMQCSHCQTMYDGENNPKKKLFKQSKQLEDVYSWIWIPMKIHGMVDVARFRYASLSTNLLLMWPLIYHAYK